MESTYDNVYKTDYTGQGDSLVNSIAVTDNPSGTLNNKPADSLKAQQTAEKLLDCPAIVGSDGKTYLQGHVSNDEPSALQVSQGIKSLHDLRKLENGIATGLTDTAQESLTFLSQPNAVNCMLTSTIRTADDTMKHYAAQPECILPDVKMAVWQAGQETVDTLGHPLTSGETGQLIGRTIPAFIIPISGAKQLTARQVESLAGIEKLAQLSTEELAHHGLTRDLTDVLHERPSSRTPRAPWPGVTTDESVKPKLDRYLLDPEHSRGGDKARVLKSALGFSRDNMIDLANQIKFDPDRALFQADTYDGPKFIQTTFIMGANGVMMEVTVVWIHNLDDVVRLVTLKKVPSG